MHDLHPSGNGGVNFFDGANCPTWYVLRGWDLHPRPPGYEPGELLLLHPAKKDSIKISYFLQISLL